MARAIRLFALCCFAAAVVGCELQEDPRDKIRFEFGQVTEARDFRVIVIGRDGLDLPALRDMIARTGGTAGHDLGIINGVAANLPGAAPLLRLAAEAGVIRIDPDVEVRLVDPAAGIESVESEGGGRGAPSGGGGSTPPPQQTPWGVSALGAPAVWSTTRGAGVKVAIIDTGIDRTHPDLSANVLGGINFSSGTKGGNPAAWSDDNGHGTHVSGTVAALDNTVGVVGVAPSAKLLGVKVLDRSGSGWLSDVVAGIDWAVQNGAQVLSMSLSSSADVQALHDACDRAAAAGRLVIAAAGNSGDGNPATNDVGYPAKYASVVAVAATDSNNNVAYFSSDGAEVEVAAPGVSVKSTWKGGGYATISGTSMATPHVSGLAALVMAAYPAWTADCVRGAIDGSATDLGAPGRDVFYGYGLVNAPVALNPGACDPPAP
ncbi:MAG: S8 family peptidase [Patescibacteria group bacterium]